MELPNSYHMLRLISNREAISSNELRCACTHDTDSETGVQWQPFECQIAAHDGAHRNQRGKGPDSGLQKQAGAWILLNGPLYNRFGAPARKDRYNGSPRTRRGRSPTSPIAWRISKPLRGGRR
jgi:hypothetical protein